MKIWALLTNVTENDFNKYGRPEELQKVLPGVEVVILDKAGINIEVGKQITFSYNGREMEVPDAFWPIFSNTDSFTIEHALMAAGAKCLINFEEYAVARSKSATYQRLAANGFQVPRTMLFFNQADKKMITDRFVYPFIIKTDNGYGGHGVEMIENEKQLDEYLSHLEYGVTYNAQEFISSSKGTDLRVVTVNHKYYYSAQRKSANDSEFKSNVHAGGTSTMVELDEKTKKMCEDISRLFDLPVLGIDLLFGEHEDDYTICEVNAFPGMKQEMLLPIVKDAIASFMKKTN